MPDSFPAEAPPITAPLGIAAVTLAVRDIGAVTAFYRDVIGLETIAYDGDVVRLGVGGVAFLELQHRPEALPDDPRSAGLYHTAFLLPSRADLARWLGHAAQRNTALQGASDHLVSEAIYLADPEGNGVEVYRDRPRETWRWEDGQVVMATNRLDLRALLDEAARSTGGPWTGVAAGTRIGHVHLRVGDVDRAAAFYAGVLGLDVTARRGGAAFLSSGGYHHHIAVNVWQSPGAGPRDPSMAGLSKVTMQAADERVLAGVTARSGGADPLGEGLSDPWGTRIEFHV